MLPASTTITRAPADASMYAVVNPVMPAPITATSVRASPRRGSNARAGADSIQNELVDDDEGSIAPDYPVRTRFNLAAHHSDEIVHADRHLTT